MQLTAIIERGGDGYVALCPEVDVASQGDSIADARKNLQEALELVWQTAEPQELSQRFARHSRESGNPATLSLRERYKSKGTGFPLSRE